MSAHAYRRAANDGPTDAADPAVEFDCTDCGRHVIQLCGPPNPTHCAACQAIPQWYNDPQLARIIDAEGDRRVNPKAAYRDDRWPERACDHCERPYRGPAVYCSFECAQADA